MVINLVKFLQEAKNDIYVINTHLCLQLQALNPKTCTDYNDYVSIAKVCRKEMIDLEINDRIDLGN